jgi:alpha-tubulin suppressor-like RCC1 family protein
VSDRHRRLAPELVWAGVIALLAMPIAAAARGAATGAGIAASDHTCVVTAAGGVKCWGDNSTGGLGDGTTIQRSTPVDVAGLASAVGAIATGDRYSCALTTDGGVKCWGYNEFGQLGDGTTINRATPVDVAGLASGIHAIAARCEHTCALADSGLKCWGANINGQLGNGTTTSGSAPVDVVGFASGISAVAVGGEHTSALTTAGGVACWGWNAAGQLGIGSTSDANAPVDVAGLSTGVRAIAAGGRHTCALMIAGGVRCWGYDEFGQLGDGTTVDRSTPVAVAGLASNITAISAGDNFTCALKTDGGVTCWGLNITYPLGNGATVLATPIDVAGHASAFTAIVAGYYHACGITRDHLVKCCGGNDTGQLGNGTTADGGTPAEVRNADGTPLLAAFAGDDEPVNLVPLALAAVVAAAAIVAAGLRVIAPRRRT